LSFAAHCWNLKSSDGKRQASGSRLPETCNLKPVLIVMRLLAASIACVLAAGGLLAQPAPPTATTIEALLAFPTFFHLKQVIVRGELKARGDTYVLVPAEGEAGPYVIPRSGRATEGPAEVRGQFWDVGRMTPDDPRFSGFDIKPLVDALHGGRWPGSGQMLVIGSASVAAPESFPAPTIRALALDPGRYDGERVTVVGQFGGRNLYGDLPKAPGISRWDFVLRSAGSAVWITNLRPRGRGFDLDPMAKVDTGRWLEVSGVVRHRGGLVWIEAAVIAKAEPAEQAAGTARPVIPPGPPPEVRFSLPSEGETDVSPATTVRLQTTRDLDEATLGGHVRVSYVEPPSAAAPAVAIQHTETWDAGNRVLTIKFAAPLERFRTVKVELLEGIKGTDRQPLKPWTLTFTTGAQGPGPEPESRQPAAGSRRRVTGSNE
jgi:Bacterial Ig-like domain